MSNLFQVSDRKQSKPERLNVFIDEFGRCNCCGAKWDGKPKCFYCKTIIDVNNFYEDEGMEVDDGFDEPMPNRINGKNVSPKSGWLRNRPSLLSRLLE